MVGFNKNLMGRATSRAIVDLKKSDSKRVKEERQTSIWPLNQSINITDALPPTKHPLQGVATAE